MKRHIILLISLFSFSCAPVSVVVDRHGNKREKTVKLVKVKKQGGVSDSLIVKLLTYYSNGHLASETEMNGTTRQGKHRVFSSTGKELIVGKYENDRRQKKWEWRGEDGFLDSLRTYNKDMLTGKSINYGTTGQQLKMENYVSNKLHGKFSEFDSNGEKTITGQYYNGIPNGKWTWFYPNGKKERLITYNHGIKNGRMVVWNKSGKKILTGQYDQDVRDGEWKWYQEEKELDSLIQFDNNHYNGKYEIWHFNGEKAIMGTYANGNKTGKWTWYSTKGELDSTKSFANGILNGKVETYYSRRKSKFNKTGVQSYPMKVIAENYSTLKNIILNENDNVKSSMVYVNGKLNGEKTDYYSNGQKKFMWTYKNGIRSGPFTEWNSSGIKRESGNYLNDKPNGVLIRWFGHGKLSSIATYSDGIIHGILRTYSPSGIITIESFYALGQEWCRFEYHDNSRLKEALILDKEDVVYQRNWNSMGLDVTNEEFKSGIFIDEELYFSGNLKSETSFKDNKLHGLHRKYSEDRTLETLSLYYKGRHLLNRSWNEDEPPVDILFPHGTGRIVINLEE